MNTPPRDFAEAQRLIDEAEARGEDHVVLPPGVYHGNTTIRIPPGFSIFGSDRRGVAPTEEQ